MENKQLKTRIRELEDIVSLLLNNWKSRHPEDFKTDDNLKLLSPYQKAKNALNNLRRNLS